MRHLAAECVFLSWDSPQKANLGSRLKPAVIKAERGQSGSAGEGRTWWNYFLNDCDNLEL